MTDEALGLIVDSCLSLKIVKVFGCTQVQILEINIFDNVFWVVEISWHVTFVTDYGSIYEWTLEWSGQSYWFERDPNIEEHWGARFFTIAVFTGLNQTYLEHMNCTKSSAIIFDVAFFVFTAKLCVKLRYRLFVLFVMQKVMMVLLFKVILCVWLPLRFINLLTRFYTQFDVWAFVYVDVNDKEDQVWINLSETKISFWTVNILNFFQQRMTCKSEFNLCYSFFEKPSSITIHSQSTSFTDFYH